MPPPEPWHLTALGTAWVVEAAAGVDEGTRAAVLDRIAAFDAVWSRFRPDSVVAEMGTRAGRWDLPPEADALLSLYGVLHDLTEGAVSPLVGDRLDDLGYGAGYALQPVAAPRPVPAWSDVTWERPALVTSRPVGLDVGAAAKGLLADLVADIVQERCGPCVVDASGDLVHRGTGPLRVALEHPHDPSRAVGVVTLRPGQALCASAVNRRAWGPGLHHVLDARTGEPTQDVVATWVVAPAGLLADGAATAAFFAEPDHLEASLGVAVARWRGIGTLEWSGSWEGEMFR